jgi:CDP-diacylglycerol--glycerol-3-phosphate 3-phosphatidyltransferase
MDPLADKVLVCAAFIGFVALDRIVPPWLVVIIISREFLVTGLRLLAMQSGVIISAGFWGKQKTIWQIVVIIVIMVGLAVREDILPYCLSAETLDHFLNTYFNRWFSHLTFWISAFVAVFTVWSGIIYFWKSKDWVMKDA